eukprot:jgi/Botrbrau1/1490/Bobra.178_3s0045.1
MSLGWKQFNFFDKEERTEQDVPENSLCVTSGNELLIFGCDDGRIVTLDRGFSSQSSFQAHAFSVQHVVWLEAYKLLVSQGREEASPSSTSIKFWDLEASSRASPAPPCVRTIKPFASKAAEAEVTTLAVCQEGWPKVSLALGLANGQVLVLRGETGRDKFGRSQYSMKAAGKASQITGLAFRKEEEDLYLFAVTPSETASFNLKTGNKVVLDEMGADADSTLMSPDGELLVSRPEAIYLYKTDSRGSCYVFQGEKHHLASLRQYLAVVTSRSSAALGPAGDTALAPSPPTVFCYDFFNKLIAASVRLKQNVRHVVSAWGVVVVLQEKGQVLCLKEKDLAFKLELLFSKSLYLVALNLAASNKAEPAMVAEIHRRYGDHLYSKHDYDGAMGQYIATIGHLEPSYVIRRFLDAQRIHNLTLYLDALHSQVLIPLLNLSSSSPTQPGVLDLPPPPGFPSLAWQGMSACACACVSRGFLRGTEGGSLPFDTETAVKVCRAAGYYEHALFVAQAAKEAGWYLDILLEDCSAFDEALAYLQDLPPDQATAALQKYGKVLVTQRPEATTALLMQLCTRQAPGATEGVYVTRIADVSHLYADRPQALILLCEYVLNSSPSAPKEQALYHTLLQLYLSENTGENGSEDAVASQPPTISSTRREQALALLKRAWPGGEDPLLDPDHVLLLCRIHNFKEGLIFLYESLRLFREVLHVHMADQDHAGLIEACIRLGDASRGGDPHLWTEVLEYFGSQTTDCTAQVKEVLSCIEAGNLLPPLVVLQALSKNPNLKLSVVKGYISRHLASENARIEEDRRAIAKYEAETACHALRAPGASHQGEGVSEQQNERECPLCAPQFHTILDIRRSIRASATEQDKFFTQLRSTPDAFNVIAEYFGRGLLNAR